MTDLYGVHSTTSHNSYVAHIPLRLPQHLVKRNTRVLGAPRLVSSFDQARNGIKISVCKVLSRLPRCRTLRLRLAMKPFRAVERP
jgi:hypothetical protein